MFPNYIVSTYMLYVINKSKLGFRVTVELPTQGIV